MRTRLSENAPVVMPHYRTGRASLAPAPRVDSGFTKNPPGDGMNLIERAKNILITPRTEWDAIAADATPTAQLITMYVLPLAAVAAVAGFIGQVFVGMSAPLIGTYRVGMVTGVIGLVFSLVMSVVMVFVVGFIADALATSFGGTKN